MLENKQPNLPFAEDSDLAAWVMEKVDAWVEYREQQYDSKWKEYYRLWRGIWNAQDKNRESERSRLVSPALSQAIEVTVSEIEEAVFSKRRWIDIDPKTTQQASQQQIDIVEQLLEEYELNGVPEACSETFLNGAIYGTGIAKVVVDTKTVRTPKATKDEDGKITLSSTERIKPIVKMIPLDPTQFAIDPMACSIDESVGVAHIAPYPLHIIEKKQASGHYDNVDVGPCPDDMNFFPLHDENRPKDTSGWCKIIEYHGLVPSRLLPSNAEEKGREIEGKLFIDPFETDLEKSDEMVEAIVTIANNEVLLRAVENPFFMKDRSFIAYQHDKVPSKFFGRGVAEKGYSPQKALDAELRGRIDAMAFAISPMIAMNTTLVPRDLQRTFKTYPGRNIMTIGAPSESIAPINFNPPPPSAFTSTGDLERMVEMGTGAVQAAAPISQNARNSTASGISMMVSATIKRNKRSLQNIERMFLDKWVRKSAWRYMQVDPDRFPMVDFDFVVNSTMGIMARELETQQLVSLMNTTPPGSPAYWMILRAIFEMSSIQNRDQMIGIIDQMMQQAMEPPKPSIEEQIKLRETAAEEKRTMSDAAKKRTESIKNLAAADKLKSEAESIANVDILEEKRFVAQLLSGMNEQPTQER